ncbi:MAG: superoxide dismutase family protein [Pseudomonadota bacterium]
MRIAMTGVAALLLNGCSGTMAGQERTALISKMQVDALTTLRTADGSDVGSVYVTKLDDGLAFNVSAKAMPAGTHGIHAHTTGRCEGPKFETAGGHWNPTMKQHGRDNPLGAHHGDLPNLVIAADGTGTVSFTVPGATLTGGGGLLDADGAAFVVHAKPDDYRTDPSGTSGDRIACGVFAES